MRATILRGLLGVGAAAGGYALIEPRLYRLTVHELAVSERAPAFDILHISDTHFLGSDRRLAGWLRGLPGMLDGVPDLVLATGDLIEDDSGIDRAIEALALIEARLGRFYVLGSHDYYQSSFQSYTRYWMGRAAAIKAPPAQTVRLEEGLADKGWVSLANRSEVIYSDAGAIRVAGVDDPHINRQRTDHLRRERDEAFAIGLVHAPDVVSEWVLQGFDLVLAGHTHGGQVRLPGIGAVVTNCSLPSGLAGGPHKVGSAWLHVSLGLGNGRFSPIRFNCRPEATLLRLIPASATPPLRDERHL